MENRKILFFDIDGTLLSHRTLTIPESAKRAVRKAKENGHLIFINTGRTISVINKEIKDLGFDGYICGCGSYIEVDGEVNGKVEYLGWSYNGKQIVPMVVRPNK